MLYIKLRSAPAHLSGYLTPHIHIRGCWSNVSKLQSTLWNLSLFKSLNRSGPIWVGGQAPKHSQLRYWVGLHLHPSQYLVALLTEHALLSGFWNLIYRGKKTNKHHTKHGFPSQVLAKVLTAMHAFGFSNYPLMHIQRGKLSSHSGVTFVSWPLRRGPASKKGDRKTWK